MVAARVLPPLPKPMTRTSACRVSFVATMGPS
jgi:hypothetical protein